VSALGPGEMRARHRPGVILTVAACRLLAGICLAMPLASLLAASGVGDRVEGDRALFESGGYLLLEVLRLQANALNAAVRGLLPVFVLGLVLTVACNAALLVALNRSGRLDVRNWLTSACERIPALLVLAAGTALVQGILLGIGLTAADAITPSPINPIRSSAAQLAVIAAAALLAGALGGFADVTKAALVRHESSLRDAISQAFTGTARRPIRSLFGWLPYAAALILAVTAVSHLT
jgi:hypothetical protein